LTNISGGYHKLIIDFDIYDGYYPVISPTGRVATYPTDNFLIYNGETLSIAIYLSDGMYTPFYMQTECGIFGPYQFPSP